MGELRGFQRRWLRSQSHALKPVVLIGRPGLTDAVVAKVRSELAAHELIKIRFGDWKDERKALSAEIAERTASELVGVVGNTALLYRPHPDPASRAYALPDRPASSG